LHERAKSPRVFANPRTSNESVRFVFIQQKRRKKKKAGALASLFL
jgi:hypothetical protein